jgi:hypothetical protein
MMSIVRGDRNGDGFDPTIFRAPLVEAKYGFTTDYLTTSSWECQQKYGAFEFDPHVCRFVKQFLFCRSSLFLLLGNGSLK